MTGMGKVCCALFLGIAVFVAGCASQTGEGRKPDWLLTSATETASERHLIVTIARNEQEALKAVARRLSSEHPIELVAEWPLQAIGVHCFVFRASDDTDLESLEQALRQSEGVRTVQRMRQFSVLSERYDDEYLGLQSSLRAINALRVHRYATGQDVQIAVIDTGVDASHPDLAAQVILARDFVAESGSAAAAAAGRGEVHGTAMAGVIAADGANGLGIVGVAPDARLLALRGCWQEAGTGRCSSFSLARALNFAIVQEADVLNLSLAGPFDPLLAELIDAALARGVVVVAAQGDNPGSAFPASQGGVVSVRSAGSGDIAGQSRGRALPAPAIDVLTTTVGGGYDFFSGASVAAAHVSGVAALLLERSPDLTPEQLQLALQRSIRDEPVERGGSVVDSCRAVWLAQGADAADRC